MYRFIPGDRVISIGGTINCAKEGRIATVRGIETYARGDGIPRYIVVFDDGRDNYMIDGSPGYIMRDSEMKLAPGFQGEPRYETDED